MTAPHPDKLWYLQRIDIFDLASMIGATRETATGVLNRFRDEGLITFDERHIVVRDPAALAARGEVADPCR